MKSEEAVFQELERERLQQQAAILGGVPGTTSTRFMIAGEAPVLLGKACEIMVRELTVRAWRHTERNRRRTLQRQDLHAAVGESEMFDFLIDLVPRITPAPPLPTAPPAAPLLSDPAPVAAAPASEQPTDASMSLSDAERRYTQLQHMQEQMQEQYMIMQQRMQPDGSAPAPPAQAQPQVMMNPHFMILPPQGDAFLPQWQVPAPTDNGAGTNTMP